MKYQDEELELEFNHLTGNVYRDEFDALLCKSAFESGVELMDSNRFYDFKYDLNGYHVISNKFILWSCFFIY